jgi:hypothetical protein
MATAQLAVETLRREYQKAACRPSDIHEHMDRLYELAAMCDSVVEGGVRWVASTWAFLYGCALRGGRVMSYDHRITPEAKAAQLLCDEIGIAWDLQEKDWLQVEIPETDLLFIDTDHTYRQLREELNRHGDRARRYIVLHDTETYRDVGMDGKSPGLWAAIDEFLVDGRWHLSEHHTRNNGLTVLARS